MKNRKLTRISTGLLILSLLVTMVPLVTLPAQAVGPGDVVLSEIRIDQTDADNDEYFELAGAAGTALDGLTYVVIGDGTGGSGVIEAVVDLSGQAIPASGYFVAAESTFSLGTADLTANLNFENSDNVTHYLVSGFTGADGDDLDTNDDGILDVMPWAELLDLIALVEEENPPTNTEYHYGPPSVGPDGNFVPGHVFRCSAGWQIGPFDPVGGSDTPGAANACAVPVPEVNMSEIRIDQPSTDNDEYFELAAAAGTMLDGLAYLVIGDGTGGSGVIEAVVDLTGQSVPASGYFVAAESTFTLGTADLTTSLNFENSDNVTHLLVGGFTGSDGQDLDTNDDGTLDSMPWSEVVDCVGLVETPGSGALLYCDTLVGPDGSFVPGHVYLCEDGWRIGEFDTGVTDSPGVDNLCDVVFTGDCGDPTTLISAVQGDGLVSPLVGTQVVIEGIVVGDFQWGGDDNGDLGGFFVQEEDGDADSNPLTSEGVLVYDSGFGVDVAVGDRVRVNGVVSEHYEKTRIGSLSDVLICDSGNSVTPAGVTLPVGSIDDLEAYEGMAVVFSQPLFISEYYNFDRYGEIVLTTGRQFQPTAIYEPGSPEAAYLAVLNLRSRIQLEDGRTSENPDPALHPNGGIFDLTNRFRGGDIVQNVTGVMDYDFGVYQIQPTEGGDYTANNPRPDAPEHVGGSLKVASFNVLNYFTTFGSRGANDQEEFDRQRDKIFAALEAIDADVVGLIEIENNGDALPDLVVGLNEWIGTETYAAIVTGPIGVDEITVALIYKPATVSALGDFAVLDDPTFTNPLNYDEDQQSRPALAQSFMDKATGGVFTAVVNHLKSKSCYEYATGGDLDQGDGRGCFNVTRTLGAEALVAWLATHPTGSGDADYLIIGDLNSYDKEDPIDVLVANGYTDLILQDLGEEAYSYVFDGQLGYLDYGLANGDLLPEVTGTTVWHINADEPDILDYDTTYKKPAQDALYEDNAYRSSDHDPVIVGLDVCDEIPPTLEISVTPDMLWPPNHKYVDVMATVNVSDNFDPNPTVTLVSVTSNEPDNGLDDGDTPNDIVIIGDNAFQLRAERSGIGEGRIYTITYEATDACGNSTVATATVTVPLSKGKGE